MKRNIAPLLFGIFFVLAGIGYLGQAVFSWDFTIFFRGWWTLFILVPAFVSILSNGPKIFNVAAFLFGGLFLLEAQNVIDNSSFGVILLGGAIAYIGVIMIVKYINAPKNNANPNFTTYTYTTNQPNGQTTINVDPTGTYQETNYTHKRKNSYCDTTNEPSYNAILSGVDAKNTSTDFQGAKVAAIMGGVDLDLRDAIITKDIVVYATAVMGGIDILAPQNVRISLVKTDILGSTTCTAISMPPDANVPIVTFNCTTIMGGIEIK